MKKNRAAWASGTGIVWNQAQKDPALFYPFSLPKMSRSPVRFHTSVPVNWPARIFSVSFRPWNGGKRVGGAGGGASSPCSPAGCGRNRNGVVAPPHSRAWQDAFGSAGGIPIRADMGVRRLLRHGSHLASFGGKGLAATTAAG